MIVLAYEQLIADVREDFATRELACEVLFGWRVPTQNLTKDRVVWVPGDHTSGDIGAVTAAKWPGRNPRPLATLGEIFTVFILGYPPETAAEVEEEQYRATRLLFDAWHGAVY